MIIFIPYKKIELNCEPLKKNKIKIFIFAQFYVLNMILILSSILFFNKKKQD